MPGFTLPLPLLADAYFPTLKKVLPVNWKQPLSSPERDHYVKAFSLPELIGDLAVKPRPYYFNATPNKYHIDTATDVSKNHQEFVHAALNNIKKAIDTWKLKAKFKDLMINGPVAVGQPGCLDAPAIKNEPSLASWKGRTPNEVEYIKAAVTGFDKQWMGWSSKVTVPGLPWYPAFAAFPGPMAPPMPNIPTPLVALPSAGAPGMLQFKMLRDAMVDALSSSVKKKDEDKQYVAIFETIAVQLSLNFGLWLSTQMVMNVLGQGPIPTFAPPIVPVGPVVNGKNIPAPGHIAS